MKKTLGLFLCLLLCLFTTAFVTSAANEPQIALSSAEAYKGGEVQINLSIKNNPGIAYLKVKVKIPDGLTLVEKPKNNALLSGSFTTSQTLDVNPYVIQWMGAENVSVDGILATLKFKVSDTCALGDKTVTLIFGEGTNENYQSVTCAAVSGKITVKCNHVFNNYVSDKNATCFLNGTKTAVCANGCGKTDTKEDIGSKLFHSFGTYTSDRNATHHSDGTKTAWCQNGCGTKDTVTDIGSKLAHEFNVKTKSNATLKTSASCLQDAVYYYSCSCGDVATDLTFADENSKLGHSFGKWATVNTATCTIDGTEKRTCSRCDKVETRAIIKTGHTRVTDKAKPATCTAEGKTEGSHCSVCGSVIIEQQIVVALGHKYIELITPPTCINDGFTTHTCSVCGYSYTDNTVAALSHSFSEWATVKAVTCTEDGSEKRTCSRCDKVETRMTVKTGHTRISDKAVPATCTSEGTTEGSHCSVCGIVIAEQQTVNSLGHSFGEWTTVNTATCTIDGIEKRTCSRCNITETRTIAKTGHTVVIDEAVAATCITDGKTEGRHCSVCGSVIVKQQTVAVLGHKCVELITPPTCINDGFTTSTCSVCGYSYTDSTVDALGHDYKTTETKATFTSDGKTETKCTVCGAVESIVSTIPKISTITLSKATCTYNGKAQAPTVTIKDSKGKVLKNGTDYTIAYKNNTKIGTATVTVTFKGSYSGTKTLSFKIVPGKVTGLKAEKQTTSAITLTWKKVSGATSYEVYSYNAKTKKYTKLATVKTTKATIKKLKAGTDYSFVVKAVANKVTGENSALLKTATAPKAPTIKVTSTAKKTAKITWSKVTGANSYVVYYSTSKNGKFKKLATVKGTSYTNKKLASGKTAYFKVVAVKTVGKTSVNSAYSAVKSVKVK